MPSGPSSAIPATFSDTARLIYAARRQWWQYELLGQVLVDAIAQCETVSFPEPEGVFPADAGITGLEAVYKDMVRRVYENNAGLNDLLGPDAGDVSQGVLEAMERIAARSQMRYLTAKRLVSEATGLPAWCVTVTGCDAWCRELQGHLQDVRDGMLKLTAMNQLIHESVGETILARVQQAQQLSEAGQPVTLDLKLRFSLDMENYAQPVGAFSDAIADMATVAGAMSELGTSETDDDVQAGTVYLHQHLFYPDMVAITVATDREACADGLAFGELPQSFACVHQEHVRDVRRADACMRSLLDDCCVSRHPTAYQVEPARVARLLQRAGQLLTG
ncbi:hypothetical protein [Noviherbaspirillum galbum]|uniref:Uncharacterized protein n=1 Tax=Noviherbaspirillum galbum TaxID=2709383 RepID=A0A6B3SNV3_9BURK|nr:hypothetical protein [Noviherbaspirillum galbum]NEX62550.1 hypothetical protein [Noviherbaspirillum galbum]